MITINKEVKDIVEIMVFMLKSYGTYDNYDKLVFTMTPDYYAQYQNANFESAIDAGLKPKLSTQFRGVRIKQMVGETYITLSCE